MSYQFAQLIQYCRRHPRLCVNGRAVTVYRRSNIGYFRRKAADRFGNIDAYAYNGVFKPSGGTVVRPLGQYSAHFSVADKNIVDPLYARLLTGHALDSAAHCDCGRCSDEQ